MCDSYFIALSGYWSMHSRNFGYEIIARPSVRPHLGVSRRKMSHLLPRIMAKSLWSHLHLWGFPHNHTCPTPPPPPPPPPINNIIFLDFQLCIGWWEGRTGIIGTFTFQWYHVIKYSCSNCITYQSFSIFNLHARFISWSMPNTDNWWGGRIASSFQKVALFYKDIQKWEKITNTTSLSQGRLSRIIGI